MSRRAVIRNVLIGAVVTGLGPLSAAGADPAGAGDSPEVLCRSTFGESGPVGGPVSGEGPSGDPMKTTIGWDSYDWPDGIREIVTCVSVGGRSAPALTMSIPAPRNDGSQVVSLTLPPGEPGTLVCEQSILVGPANAAGPQRTTRPVCFKLRPNEPPAVPAAPAAGASAGALTPAPLAPPVPAAPSPKLSARAPAPPPAFNPPPGAAAEAARSRTGIAPNRRRVPDPGAGVTLPAPAWPDPAWPPAAAARARQSIAAAAAPTPAAAATSADPATAPVTALARTGIDEHIPLASAGGFLAIGGAAIILGAPAGRRRARRPI